MKSQGPLPTKTSIPSPPPEPQLLRMNHHPTSAAQLRHWRQPAAADGPARWLWCEGNCEIPGTKPACKSVLSTDDATKQMVE